MPAKDTDAEMTAFVARHGLDDMVQVVDDDGDIWARFSVRVQPAWFFLPAGGEPIAVYGGLFDGALDDRIEQSFS
ncbi:MAG: hypothetical protein WD010_07565 [Nitriliruptor sp.]